MQHICKICNKTYASYKSLWLHNSKFHNDLCNTNVTKDRLLCNKNVTKCNTYFCIQCNEEFSNRQTKWRHEKICKNKVIPKNETFTTTPSEVGELKKEIGELKEMLQKALKVHPKTLKKINTQLNNYNSNIQINNNIINNINIVPLGLENLHEILPETEKLKILNDRANGLREIVKLVHISKKYPQFNNICITNLQNNVAYKYDTKTNNFMAVNKNELLDDLIDCRMCDIETFYNELADKLDVSTLDIIQRFLDRMTDGDDKLKDLKKEEIKLLLYNNRKNIQDNKLEL
jgi:hypothetical protein